MDERAIVADEPLSNGRNVVMIFNVRLTIPNEPRASET
jgi:hypothetical protein